MYLCKPIAGKALGISGSLAVLIAFSLADKAVSEFVGQQDKSCGWSLLDWRRREVSVIEK